jgi:ferrochelatase
MKGVLLINLGTPDKADSKSVYAYLTQFLNDPRVVALPWLIRSLLVNLLIVPFRFRQSVHAYQQIWTEQGSPLLLNSHKLMTCLQQELGDTYHVELGMRYGKPSIASALKKLEHCQHIVVIPLFPQYSSAATGSALEEVFCAIGKKWNIPALHIHNDFYNHPDFIRAYAEITQQKLTEQPVEVVLFSYHGLPEIHLDKSECRAACSRQSACPMISDKNASCYRAQCYETTRALATHLNLKTEQYRVSFQSRLGKTPWIKPYTDEVLTDLIQQGIKNIAVVCPSFVSDCLETLEEINIRARAQWKSLGGGEFVFVPCLNDNKTWVKALADLSK